MLVVALKPSANFETCSQLLTCAENDECGANNFLASVRENFDEVYLVRSNDFRAFQTKPA